MFNERFCGQEMRQKTNDFDFRHPHSHTRTCTHSVTRTMSASKNYVNQSKKKVSGIHIYTSDAYTHTLLQTLKNHLNKVSKFVTCIYKQKANGGY